MIHRLASLLWRLRRAHAVETGLLGIQGKLQRDIRLSVDQKEMFNLRGLEETVGSNDRSCCWNVNGLRPRPGRT